MRHGEGNDWYQLSRAKEVHLRKVYTSRESCVLLESIPVLVIVGNNTDFHQLEGREGVRMQKSRFKVAFRNA